MVSEEYFYRVTRAMSEIANLYTIAPRVRIVVTSIRLIPDSFHEDWNYSIRTHR
jgi:hypothetical protein